ncbi:MAG: NADH-quinone oxidoreductase subunit L [Acidobacteria bacterium]|nr:NADH-quinone oxidoreductase subunit L [Acidobacteriota bacterium]
MLYTRLLAPIILTPLIGAIILGLFGKRMSEKLIGWIACSSVAVSAIFSFYAFFHHWNGMNQGYRIHQRLFTWISVGNFRADFALLLDPLSAIYIVFITFVAFWIHVFATGYMKGETGYWRFFAYLNLFMFSMLTLILGDNFLLMFVGWEGVGLCSYLLIGYYFTKGFASDAAKKAFVFNRVGDFGFALGVMLLFLKSGSIFYFDDPRGVTSAFEWAIKQASEPLSASMIFAGGLTTIAVLLFVGATGKSAQIPLFVWLPDAMAGPTPVSALIHAATMVTAGVYMVARASSIYIHAPTALMIVAIIGAATALLAATIGIAQSDIKKVLAYSTVSQLGYMFLACGVGAFTGGIFHVFTHAFFKALLFLGSGSVIVGMHHEQDMRKMGGLKKYMPITFWTMFAGYLAIAGIPPLSGFFSKDEILYRTFTTDAFNESNFGESIVPIVLWVVGALTALLTAIYMTRMMVMTFGGKERFNDNAHHSNGHDKHSANDAHDSHGNHHGGTPHETPKVMTTPLVVLALGAVVVGFLGMPSAFGVKNYFEHFLEPSIASLESTRPQMHDEALKDTAMANPDKEPKPLTERQKAETEIYKKESAAAKHSDGQSPSHTTEWALMGLSVLIAIAGIFIGRSWFTKNPLWQPPRLLEEKYRVDELYDATIIQPIKQGSTKVLWKFIDVKIIDGFVNTAGATAKQFGELMRHLQSGFARSYVALVVLGALLILGYFILRIR